MLVNRIKVLPALREAVAHCMQQQRYVEKSTWKRGGMEKKYYILERPIGDCKHAERSNLIANVAFRRVWNDTSKHTCWVGSNALVTIDEASDSSEGGYRFKTIWDKRSRNSIATPMSGMADGSNKGKTSSKFDWIGKSWTQVGGLAKAKGETVYADDLFLPDLWLFFGPDS